MADARGFSIRMDQFAKHLGEKMVHRTRQIALDAVTSLVLGSPVGNATIWKRNVERASRGLPPVPRGYVGGHFRKGWQLEWNIRPAAPTKGVDASGQQTIDAALARLAAGPRSVEAIQRIYITNLVPYGPELERGHSRQAPRGILRETARAIEAKYGRGGR